MHVPVPRSVVSVIVDDDVAHRLINYGMSLEAKGYVKVWLIGAPKSSAKSLRLHAFVIGPAPDGQEIDHINGNRLDNRRCNLRHVARQTNQVNRKALNRNNTSGYRGVNWCPRRSHLYTPWNARICVNRRGINLGYFQTPAIAAEARRVAEMKYYGALCPTSRAA